MAEKRYYWLKFRDDFFDSKRIKKLRKMAGGDTYTIIYLKMMLKTWVKEAGITDVGAFFSVRDAKAELSGWSDRFASVTSRGYMKGYRDLGKAIPWLYRKMCSLCDGFISMQIVRIAFAE